jgi:CDP-diacylglycerol---glycerol-3-phosphate 3-phosphatidyltransferase
VSGTGSAGRHRSPPWTNPANAVTLLRVAMVPVIAVLIVLDTPATRGWALALFVCAALSDSIDGWVARRYAGSTRWGAIADPAADKFLVIGVLGLLALQGVVAWWALTVLVVREVGVTVLRSHLLRRGTVMPASNWGKAKTLSQFIAVTLYLVPGVPERIADAVLVLAVVLALVSAVDYVRSALRPADAR